MPPSDSHRSHRPGDSPHPVAPLLLQNFQQFGKTGLYRPPKTIHPLIRENMRPDLVRPPTCGSCGCSSRTSPKTTTSILIGRPNLLAALDLGVNHDIKSRVTYSVITKRLNVDDMRDFLLRELDRVGLGHNTFTRPAVDLVVRSADGVLRQARNLSRRLPDRGRPSANKTIDIDNVNRVLMQPHWQKEADLTDY